MQGTLDKSDSTRRLRVFLCHSSGDKPAVRDLCHRLRADGVDPWLDEEKLLPGQDWREEIPEAVRTCDVVVVCLSHQSVSKEGYLQREIRDALYVAEEKPEGTIFIIPARLEEVDVPKRLSRWHWANLFQEGGYQQLMKALKVRAKTIGLSVSPLKGTVIPAKREGKRPIESKKSVAEHPDIVNDPETGLMWTKEDNGKDINWYEANEYRERLSLGGYTDWRLPTIEELEKLYDPKKANIRDPFQLTGRWVWSSTKRSPDFPLLFGFVIGERYSALLVDPGNSRALCVRRSGK